MTRSTNKLFSNKVWICLFLTTVWASLICSLPNENRSSELVEPKISGADSSPVTTTDRPSTDDLIDYDFDTGDDDNDDDGPNPAMVQSISPYQTNPSFSCIILPIFLSVVVK
ncbi:uncharacterized protein LOC123475296 [Daphnia magna]|uniref:Uncharacterized protein n=1 Tax=Daphnia magna TaxID=35525 RepID=A0A164M0Q9_9CRUS|nr:uncharacterized protein LOC123475296 [Daphnia magna]KZS04612.1 Uncharacterized protein APZ42_032423 [Daphnia magna]